MSIEEKLIEKLHSLPPDKQKQVLEFVESLKDDKGSLRPLRSLRGLWADFPIEVTEQDIAEIRREMWRDFPREDF